MVALAAVVVVALAACGQKGPLYLPGHSKDTPWPVPPPLPATLRAPADPASGSAADTPANAAGGSTPTPASPAGSAAAANGAGATATPGAVPVDNSSGSGTEGTDKPKP